MTALTGYIQGLGGGERRTVDKTGKEVKLSVFENIDDVIVFNQEGETKQEGTPTPSNPVDIEGIGFLYHGAYAVAIDYDDGDEHYGRILATGLSYPLYEGDILDFANGKVIRANGYVEFNGSPDEHWMKYNSGSASAFAMASGIRNDINKDGMLFAQYLKGLLRSETWGNFDNWISVNADCRITTGIRSITILNDWLTYLSNNPLKVVYPLETPTEEYITITGGDIADIGMAVVEADGTLTVKYDKVEMAIRKYSAKPDWQKIGYTDTPQIILDAFDYSKRIFDSWTPSTSYASAYRGDKALKFFPEVDITGATNYTSMFESSGILSTPPLTIGDGSSTVIDSRWMFQNSPIEDIEITNDSETQKVILDYAFKSCSYLKKAKLNLSATGSMASAFADCTRLKRIEDGLDTSSVTSLSEAFRACSSLEYLYELDLSSCTSCYKAFQDCTSLESAPYLNNILQNVNFAQMFWNCNSLKNLPFIRLSSASNLTNMFQGTGSNLDENSRKNLLWMLTGCTYSGTKTLAHLGFTSSMYSASSWQSLSNYNEFVSEGWSIGYS
jgi:hypothetical protein